MMHDIWNPWHGCLKYSEGCKNCYMYYARQQAENLLFFKGAGALGQRERLGGGGCPEVFGEGQLGNETGRGQIGAELQHVAQLPHIARPVVGQQAVQGLGR